MGVGLPRRLCSALLLHRSARHFCAAPKLKLPPPGGMQSDELLPKRRWLPERTRDERAAASRQLMYGPRRPLFSPLRHRRRIPFNEELQLEAMRDAAVKDDDIERIQAWAGQSAGLARPEPAGEAVRRIWEETQALFR